MFVNDELYLRRRRRIFVAPVTQQDCTQQLSPQLVAGLLKNIEGLGYTLSLELQERVAMLTLDQLGTFYTELTSVLQKLVGAHVRWEPFYPDFPAQVIEMSEAQLYLNALYHYLSNQRLTLPKAERLALVEDMTSSIAELRPLYSLIATHATELPATPGVRPPLLENVDLKVIELGSVADFESIFTSLVGAKTSISQTDKEDVVWFISSYENDILRLMPEAVASRENLALVGAALLQQTTVGEQWIRSNVKTATDVLRLAVALHGGDVSLAAPTKVGKFSRPQRRLLLELVEGCPNATEDMLRWKMRWVRLGEKLHPGEWKERFPNAHAAFEVVRGNAKFASFGTKVERALETKSAGSEPAVALLQARPGEFARRLDHLLRLDPARADVTLEAFASIAEKVSTPVLLQVLTHFKHRAQPHDLRIFFPKGEVAKVWGQTETLEPLDAALCEKAVAHITTILVARFAALPVLGTCYLDSELKNYLVPFSQRSASKSLRTLARGSRLTLPDANTIRFFLWWKNGQERTDLDLSAAIYDAEFVYKDVLSYYSLKNYGGHHSGDIVDAPNGAAEFIDIDRAKMLEMGVRYVVMSVNSFTSQPYCDLPECFTGWMARQEPNSGEVFEPKTVQDRIDLSANTQICLPLVIDLETRTVVWMDLALRNYPSWNNVQNNLKGVSLMLRAMIHLEKTTLYDLFTLHIAARGQLVTNKEEATQVFSLTEGLTPFDLDVIASQWI